MPSPKVLNSPHNLKRTVGSEAVFTCDFESTNDTKVAHIHWVFNEKDLMGSGVTDSQKLSIVQLRSNLDKTTSLVL